MKSLDTINVWNLSCDLAIRTAKILSSCDESEICKLTSRSALPQLLLRVTNGIARTNLPIISGPLKPVARCFERSSLSPMNLAPFRAFGRTS